MSILSWQFLVPINPAFRFKYFLTLWPKVLVCLGWLTTWLCGALAMHFLEPMYASLWDAMYDSWILMLDAPPNTPVTSTLAHLEPTCALRHLDVIAAPHHVSSGLANLQS